MKYDVADVRESLDRVVAQYPDRVDRRSEGNLYPRYVEHGCPACLVGVILDDLGIRIGVLRDLDREKVRLISSRHPVRKKFTPAAWELLDFLQTKNDCSYSWSRVREAAFTVKMYPDYLVPSGVRREYPGIWCNDSNVLK